jgi:putative transposase
MRKTQFANNYLYHIYNRGTDKRNIFLEDADYFRFIHDLYEFNNLDPILNLTRRIRETEGGPASLNRKKRELLVEIIAFCLMPNHFHLVLRQMKDSGIAKFMQKLGTGYTMYFNKKNKRNGVLFQGKFKAILVDNDNYFLPLFNYVHLNPVELAEAKWKEEGIKDKVKVNNFLENYRWSSYQDYIGIKNFPSIINKNFFNNFFKEIGNYKTFINHQFASDLEPIKDIILE